jgi:cob(I)alamin adenosyltransferase
MVKLNRITTRTGDDGTTGLADGTRVRKDDPRIEVCGAVDELNCVLGMVVQAGPPAALQALLRRVQNDLFDVGADLATPGADGGLRIVAAQVAALDAAIEEINAPLQSLSSFVLPGGSLLACWLHLARAVCRRAERRAVALSGGQVVSDDVLRYLNRLSDLLFVMARAANEQGRRDVLWEPGRYRA